MEYILDVAKWRCGDNGPYQLGTGSTQFLNEEGYMCCLGQFAKQKGVKDCALESSGTPSSANEIGGYKRDVYDRTFVDHLGRDTILAGQLIGINDALDTTPQQKIEKLRFELEAKGHTLKVVNEDILEH